MHFPFILVNTEESLRNAVLELSRFTEIAFDSEGVSLSRSGTMTVAIFLGITPPKEQSPAYVVDVQTLGGAAAFKTGLGKILESRQIRKITFDCRSDSDALFHQYGYFLNHVLDMQVYEQAVRFINGEPLPNSTTYINGKRRVPFVRGMSQLSKQYIDTATLQALGGSADNGPHKTDPLVWQKRPLALKSIQYAANDAFITRELLFAFRNHDVPRYLMNGVFAHSERYTRHLRDILTPATFASDKYYIMEEISILK